MKRRIGFVVVAAAWTLAACSSQRLADERPQDTAAIAAATPQRSQFAQLAYPAAPRDATVDVHHGVSVPDPFRPLEDLDAPATAAWVAAENEVTRAFLDAVPERTWFAERLTKLWNFERFGVPRVEGGKTFFTRNDGLQNQSVLMVQDAEGAEPRLLLDPNTLSADGTVALSSWRPSRDGKLLAYAVAASGSDWKKWRVRDVATGKDLADELQWLKSTQVSWTLDGSGFWYSRYDAPAPVKELTQVNQDQKLCFHRLGTPQSADPIVYERPDQPKWAFGAGLTEDGRYLTISTWRGTERKNLFSYKDLTVDETRTAPPVELLGAWDASWDFLGNAGDTFYFDTDKDAPRHRIVAIDLAKPGDVRTVVPESADAIDSSSLVGGKLIVSYLHDAHSVVRVFDLSGKQTAEVPLPGLGSADGFAGDASDPVTYFSYAGFTTPTTIYRYEVASNAATVFRRPTVDFRSEDFETSQVFVTSKDGTRVPMFLTHRKGLRRDGTNPVYLSGYGGFGIAQTPFFSVSALPWMEKGGVLAVACLRGGGEYGREWHLAGTKLRKQNVFDDFIACAEWLVNERVTSSPRLAIAGGSNGGLLVGACMTQRPDLFGACLPAVGVMDMLRFHKFTVGWGWASDYGTADDPAEFAALHAYSPLHNLRPGVAYPPTMVTTADHDDRVVPGHSFKFAAALQEAQSCANPVLIRVEVKAGHGAGKPITKQIAEAADRWAFLWRVMGMSETR